MMSFLLAKFSFGDEQVLWPKQTEKGLGIDSHFQNEYLLSSMIHGHWANINVSFSPFSTCGGIAQW